MHLFFKGMQLRGSRLALKNQRFPVEVRLLAMCRGEISAVIALLSVCDCLSACYYNNTKIVNRPTSNLIKTLYNPVIQIFLKIINPDAFSVLVI